MPRCRGPHSIQFYIGFSSIIHGRAAWSARNQPGPIMSITIAENHIRDAREQHSQQDINASVLKAMSELTRQIKRLDDEVRRARRDAQMSRRF